MQTSSASGLRRAAVMLLHGLSSSPLEMRRFGRWLRQRGFEVHAPMLPGYSATADDSRPARADYQTWIAAAVDEFDRLHARFGRVALCGVSLGATLALAAAAERADVVGALSLVSTTLFFDGWNVPSLRFLLPVACLTPLGRLYRYRETPPYGVRNEAVREWVADRIEQGRLSSAGAPTISIDSLREATRLIRHVKRTLRDVRSPLLMVHAREDDVASLANVRYVRRHAGSALVRELIVADSYHMITIDNDAERAASATAEFFSSVIGR